MNFHQLVESCDCEKRRRRRQVAVDEFHRELRKRLGQEIEESAPDESDDAEAFAVLVVSTSDRGAAVREAVRSTKGYQVRLRNRPKFFRRGSTEPNFWSFRVEGTAGSLLKLQSSLVGNSIVMVGHIFSIGSGRVLYPDPNRRPLNTRAGGRG